MTNLDNEIEKNESCIIENISETHETSKKNNQTVIKIVQTNNGSKKNKNFRENVSRLMKGDCGKYIINHFSILFLLNETCFLFNLFYLFTILKILKDPISLAVCTPFCCAFIPISMVIGCCCLLPVAAFSVFIFFAIRGYF